MRYRIPFVAVIVCAFGLTACSLPLPLARNAETTQVEELLAHYRYMSMATLDDQRNEFIEASLVYKHSPTDGTRLRLALALLIPGAPWRDDARAAQLLGAIDSTPSPRHDLVVLLEQMAQLRHDDLKRCERKMEVIRDERRKAEQKLEIAQEECKRADLLQQKLDKLRNIDRDLRNKRPLRRTTP